MILDEAALALVRARQPKAQPHLAERTAAEITSASTLFDQRGWSAEPAGYHRRPPCPVEDEVSSPTCYRWPRRHESVTFPSGFHPRSAEPASERWPRDSCNDTVFVRLLRHGSASRPWVVCLHGFGMGTSRFDVGLLWANHFHTALGFNVAVPVLPLHGPRKPPGGAELLSLDLAMTIHAITQAIWDVRRLIQWIRLIGGQAVGVYGISLGGFLAALLAGIERVDGVVAGIPFTDVPALMTHHRAPQEYSATLCSEAARNAFRVVSPLGFSPQVPPSRLALFAGRSDRFIPPDQSDALAQAWSPSSVHRYRGGHTGYLWSRQTKRFVTDFLHGTLT